MKAAYLFLCTACAVASCSHADYESDYLPSPSTHYFIKTSVNRSISRRKDYALIKLHLYQSKIQHLDSLTTDASDVMAWAVTWVAPDTIALYSSDVGTQAWMIAQQKFQPVKVTSIIQQKAASAYKEKYHK